MFVPSLPVRRRRKNRTVASLPIRRRMAWPATTSSVDAPASEGPWRFRRARASADVPAVRQDDLAFLHGAGGAGLLDVRDDGTTDLVVTPTAFLERLAVLVPRPRVNLVRYHGLLAPRAAWRTEVVPRPAAMATDAGAAEDAFGFDVLACSRCGGRLRLIAVLDASDVTQRILRHLGRSTEVPAARPARAPPMYDDAASLNSRAKRNSWPGTIGSGRASKRSWTCPGAPSTSCSVSFIRMAGRFQSARAQDFAELTDGEAATAEAAYREIFEAHR